MVPFVFNIAARRETHDEITLDLNPGPVDGYKNGNINGTGEWMRALVLHARKETAPQLYEELKALPLETEFVFALVPPGSTMVIRER